MGLFEGEVNICKNPRIPPVVHPPQKYMKPRGSPESKDSSPTIIKYYIDKLPFTYKLELKGKKTVVSNSLRQETLETAQRTHRH